MNSRLTASFNARCQQGGELVKIPNEDLARIAADCGVSLQEVQACQEQLLQRSAVASEAAEMGSVKDRTAARNPTPGHGGRPIMQSPAFARFAPVEVKSNAIAAPGYFHTFEQMKATLEDFAARYPELAKVEKVGETREGREILALTLTSPRGLDKPTFLGIGGIHPREVANPELLIEFARMLLAGYGKDPVATGLLDSRKIVLAPMVNVDGHVRIEEGFRTGDKSLLDWRLNAADVDLNRNYDAQWGGDDTSPGQDADDVRGPAPFSEPETQAVRNLVNKLRPDFFIDFHSTGKSVLYPPGYTPAAADDKKQLEAMATRLADAAHYTNVAQESVIYVASGLGADYVHDQLGIPAFTVETGKGEFIAPEKEYVATKHAGMKIAITAATMTNHPDGAAIGPRVTRVTIQDGRLNAVLVPGKNGAVSGAEVVTDPITPPGQGTHLQLGDNEPDGSRRIRPFELSGLGSSRLGELLYVRARDADGVWGALQPQWLKRPETARPSTVDA